MHPSLALSSLQCWRTGHLLQVAHSTCRKPFLTLREKRYSLNASTYSRTYRRMSTIQCIDARPVGS